MLLEYVKLYFENDATCNAFFWDKEDENFSCCVAVKKSLPTLHHLYNHNLSPRKRKLLELDQRLRRDHKRGTSYVQVDDHRVFGAGQLIIDRWRLYANGKFD